MNRLLDPQVYLRLLNELRAWAVAQLLVPANLVQIVVQVAVLIVARLLGSTGPTPRGGSASRSPSGSPTTTTRTG